MRTILTNKYVQNQLAAQFFLLLYLAKGSSGLVPNAESGIRSL